MATIQISAPEKSTAEKVNEMYSKILETYQLFCDLSKFIKSEQGPYDPVALKMEVIARALGPISETDVIQMVLHLEQMQNKIS